jgi:DNA-binding CsgD family transcriptional regulator
MRDLAQAQPAPRRLSDFTPGREWRGRGLFNDFYRPLGMTRELAIQLVWGPVGSSCCVVLHRDGRDFSERERVTLELVAPHLRAARARIAAQAPLARRLALLERGFEQTRGALVVGSGGRVLAAGDHARELLLRWFNESPAALPDDLAGWWASVREGPAPPAFETVSGERRLRARLVAGADEDLVILSERGDSPAPSELARLLPITRREADVLARLAAGRTNDGIAHDLGISRHTVVRHVESVYTKLDVRTRAAATRAALDALHDFQTGY